jgi:hypothetical protein
VVAGRRVHLQRTVGQRRARRALGRQPPRAGRGSPGGGGDGETVSGRDLRKLMADLPVESDNPYVQEVQDRLRELTSQLFAVGRAVMVTEDLITEFWFDERGQLVSSTRPRWEP